MRAKHEGLDRVTWDQAAILGMASAGGFRALHIDPAHVRLWASQGAIKPVAVGPRGYVLYLISDVTTEALTRGHKCSSSPGGSSPTMA